MTPNDNGNGQGPGWRTIALALVAVVLPIVGWVVTTAAQDVKEIRTENRVLSDRLGRLEVRYVEDVATIKEQLSGLVRAYNNQQRDR